MIVAWFGAGMLFDSGTKEVLAAGYFGTVWLAFGFFGLILLYGLPADFFGLLGVDLF